MILQNNREISIISHILEYCKQIEECLSRFGNNFECFTSDAIYRNAVSMAEFQIGELSGRLSDDFKEQHKSTIPWKEVRGMRNIFAHNYLEMDITKIWNVAIVDVPVLREFCVSVLNEIDSQLFSENCSQDKVPRQIDKTTKATLDDRLKQAHETHESQVPQEHPHSKSNDHADR